MTRTSLVRMLRRATGRLRAEVGIAVDADGVHVVRVRRGDVVWTGEMAFDEASGSASIGECLTTLFAKARVGGWPLERHGLLKARAAHLSLSSPMCRVKRLEGLPQPCPDELLERIVKANVSRFFVGTDITPEAVAVYQDSADRVWGAAFDSGVVQAVAAACETAGVRLRRVVPAKSCIRATAPQVETAAKAEGAAETAELSAGLAEASRAARDGCNDPLVIGLGRGTLDRRHATNILRLASAAAILLLSASMTLPALTSRQQTFAATSELRVTSRESARALKTHGELSTVTSGLEAFAEFTGGRRSMLSLISQLASALPDDAAILNVRLTVTEGTLTIVGSDVTAAAAALEGARDVASSEVVGLVTRTTSTAPHLAVDRESGAVGSVQVVREQATVRVALRPVEGMTSDTGGVTRARQ